MKSRVPGGWAFDKGLPYLHDLKVFNRVATIAYPEVHLNPRTIREN